MRIYKFGPKVSYLIFEASEALQKWEGIILMKTRLFHWVSSNSEVEANWTSLFGWPHKTYNTSIFEFLFVQKNFKQKHEIVVIYGHNVAKIIFLFQLFSGVDGLWLHSFINQKFCLVKMSKSISIPPPHHNYLGGSFL